MSCLIVTENTISDAINFINTHYNKADIFEVRLDYLSDLNKAGIKALFKFDKPIIATCREEKDCGLYKGSVFDKRKLFQECLDAGASYIDVEIENIDAFKDIPNDKIILSKHFTADSLGEVELVYHSIVKHDPAYIKIVILNDEVRFNNEILSLLEKYNNDGKIIAHQCGTKGISTRLLYKKFKCPWTYFTVDNKDVAPGMITYQDTVNYNIENVDENTRIYGIIGNPIKYALSPRYFNKYFMQKEMNCIYVPFELNEISELSYLLEQKTLDLQGMSVTMPFKEQIIKFADIMDESVVKTGAANTVKFKANEIHLYNTDYLAIKEMLKNVALENENVLILGSGGVAKTVASIMSELNCNIYICNRNEEKAQELIDKYSLKGFVAKTEINDINPKLIVNTTPVGMHSTKQLPVPENCINENQIVFDVIHNPEETELLKIARQKKAIVLKGLDMFRLQAKHQMTLWGLL